MNLRCLFFLTSTLAATCVANLLFVSSVASAPISLIYTTLDATGRLNDVSFATSNVTITVTGDTDNVTDFGSVSVLLNSEVTIAYNGLLLEVTNDVSGANIYDPFVNRGVAIAGFSRTFNDGGDLLFSTDAAYSTWDLRSSLGPIDVVHSYIQWANPTLVQTNAGALIFDNRQVSGTFQAIVGNTTPVPLPGGLPLVLTALGGLVLLRRAKRA